MPSSGKRLETADTCFGGADAQPAASTTSSGSKSNLRRTGDGLLHFGGEFAPLLDWLRTRIHRTGHIHEGDDLINEVTGSRLQHGPFMRYLWGKFGPLYGVEVRA